MKPEQYHALIPNRCPAYITLERYERNQRRIRENRTRPDTKGPPREGPALLGGIVFCGRCGRRMTPHYPGVKTQFRYACSTGKSDCDLPRCQNLSGQVLDDLVAEKILQALAPAALELSLLAADDLEQERQRLDKHWQQRLERSRYECDRAQRRQQAVEPENRLVARELERQWESTLHEMRDLEQQYGRFRQAHSATLSNEERQLIRALAENLPAVWKSPTTSPGDRQRIIRLLVERVVITMQGFRQSFKEDQYAMEGCHAEALSSDIDGGRATGIAGVSVEGKGGGAEVDAGPHFAVSEPGRGGSEQARSGDC